MDNPLESGSPGAQQEERSARLNQVYLLIISRYKDYIEEKEEISVAELPRFVTPKARLVSRKAQEITAQFSSYSYEENFSDAAMSAFRFVKNEIEEVALPLQFWLSPEDTLTLMVGDTMDKNILLCSLLIALGNPSAKVLVVADGAERDVKSYYELSGRITMFDIAGNAVKDFDTREEMVESLNLGGESAAYEFNDQTYIDIR